MQLVLCHSLDSQMERLRVRHPAKCANGAQWRFRFGGHSDPAKPGDKSGHVCYAFESGNIFRSSAAPRQASACTPAWSLHRDAHREQHMDRSRAGLQGPLCPWPANGMPTQLGLTPGEAHDNRLCWNY